MARPWNLWEWSDVGIDGAATVPVAMPLGGFYAWLMDATFCPFSDLTKAFHA